MFDIVPLPLFPLLKAAPPEPGLYLAEGARGLDSWLLAALLPALARGLSPFWVDAGNSFDAYGAGYAARALGLPPKETIARVRLARAFNLFQLETMVCESLPALWRGEPIVLSDPLALFHEEDVPREKARGVFERTLAGMERLGAAWLVLSTDRGDFPGRRGLLEALGRRAAGRARLEGAGPERRLFPAGA